MKQLNINLFAVIFSMIWIFNSFGEEKAFYYYQNEKIHIEPQRDKIIIYAGKTKTPIDDILRNNDIRLDQL